MTDISFDSLRHLAVHNCNSSVLPALRHLSFLYGRFNVGAEVAAGETWRAGQQSLAGLLETDRSMLVPLLVASLLVWKHPEEIHVRAW